MTKCSPEFLSFADDCLRQFAQTGNDALSAILTPNDLHAFQAGYPGFKARDSPPIKTLTLFMKQVASDTKSCRHALIDEARDQAVSGNKPSSTGTGAYTKARQRLTEESIKITAPKSSGTQTETVPRESGLSQCHCIKVWIAGVDFPVLLFRQVFTNKDGSKGILYLICSDLECDTEALKAIYKKGGKLKSSIKRSNPT